ncbi:secreted protein [Candidatus Magnetoovum chiemensis]|nr:secreted protein [Candidatus Magnetoovum chiemensis]
MPNKSTSSHKYSLYPIMFLKGSLKSGKISSSFLTLIFCTSLRFSIRAANMANTSSRATRCMHDSV